jgi:ribonuclease BN (tRNA processing enzyme)
MGFKQMSKTKLVLLGTGTPNILPNRYQSSLAVIVDDKPFIVDCGGGTMQRISQAYHEKNIEALAMPKLTHLFLTHLHPDHTTGLADFIIAPWVLDRSEVLQIWGPKGTQSLVDNFLAAYEISIAEHRDGIAPINHPLQVEVTEIEAGQIYQDTNVTVEAIRVSHGGLDAFGYTFTTVDKKIVISGDTCPVDVLIEQAKNCDILVHEVYSAKQFQQRSSAWQAYHSQVHTSTTELAAIANKTHPKLLLLFHQLFWGSTETDLLAEIQSLYDGEVISGQDLDIFE